jgi:hypothetical protein
VPGLGASPLRYLAVMADRPPLAVLIGGAPGSGKTTLADALGVGLDLPVLHKDSLVHGRWRTLDRGMELAESGVEPFFRSMVLWAETGISFVAEQTFYPQVSEEDVRDRLAPLSVVVHVHCQSAHSLGRWERRMREDPLCGDTRLNKLLPVVERLNLELIEPLDFGCPVFVVNTDDDYEPTLESLISEIDALYSPLRFHDLDPPSETE